MKRYSNIIISLLVCALMLGVTISAQLAEAQSLQVTAHYAPDRIRLNERPKWGFWASMYFPKDYNPRDINLETVLLEGLLSPTYTAVWPIFQCSETMYHWFLVKFDLDAVTGMLLAKLSHMGDIRRVQWVRLTVTGEFYDGTVFEATGKILVYCEGPWD
jgi:hypothetical protein